MSLAGRPPPAAARKQRKQPRQVPHTKSQIPKNASRREHLEIFANASLETDEDRVADQRVADRNFVEMRQATEQHQIVEVEIVTRIHTKTECMRQLRGA